MPKITSAGPSNAWEPAPEAPSQEAVEVTEAVVEPEAVVPDPQPVKRGSRGSKAAREA